MHPRSKGDGKEFHFENINGPEIYEIIVKLPQGKHAYKVIWIFSWMLVKYIYIYIIYV